MNRKKRNHKFLTADTLDYEFKKYSDAQANKALDDQSLLEKTAFALNKLGAGTKLGIIKGLESATGNEAESIKNITLSDITGGRKTLGGAELRRAIEQTTGIDLTLGEEENQNVAQKVGTFIEDLALDIATDPLTYLTGGISRLAKLGVTGKALLGAGLGASFIDANDSIGDMALKVGGGAVAGPKAVSAVKWGGNAIAKVGEKFIDDAVRMAKPEAFKNIDIINQSKKAEELISDSYTGAMKTLTERDARLAPIINDAGRELTEPFKNLSPLQVDEAEMLLTKASEDTLVLRNKLEEEFKKATGRKSLQANNVGDLALLRGFTKKANTAVGQNVKMALAERGDDELAEAVFKYQQANRSTIRKFNEAVYGDNVSKYIEPIDFHVPDVLPEEALDKIVKTKNVTDDQLLGFVKRNREVINDAGLSFEQRRELYANRLANAYSTKAEKQAKQLVNAVRNTKPPTDLAKGAEWSLKNYDKFTNFLKALHLTTTHSWVVNNYSDNILRAYLAGGAGNAYETLLKTNPLQLLNRHNNMLKDMFKFSSPKLNYTQKIGLTAPDIQHAIDSGLINSGFFKDITKMADEGYDIMKVKVGKQRADEILEQVASRGGLSKGLTAYTDFFGNTVGRTGSAIESTAKLITYKNHQKTLINTDLIKQFAQGKEIANIRSAFKRGGIEAVGKTHPEQAKAILDEATKFTQNIFFDYSNIRPFEQLVMKRIFPYYTFFSRNTMFYMEQLLKNPSKLNQILGVRRSIGKDLTDKERSMTPEYLLAQGVRNMGRHGKKMDVVSFPNMSMVDAINTLNSKKEGLSKLNPLLKSPMELIGNIDMFLGGSQYPSSNRNGKKTVFRSALALEPFGGIHKTESGGLYTTNDFVQGAANLKSNLLPTPLLDTILGGLHDVNTGRKTGLQVITNLSPVKTRTLKLRKQR